MSCCHYFFSLLVEQHITTAVEQLFYVIPFKHEHIFWIHEFSSETEGYSAIDCTACICGLETQHDALLVHVVLVSNNPHNL